MIKLDPHLIRAVVLNLLEDNLPCAFCGGEADDPDHDIDEAIKYHEYRPEYDISSWPEWDEVVESMFIYDI